MMWHYVTRQMISNISHNHSVFTLKIKLSWTNALQLKALHAFAMSRAASSNRWHHIPKYSNL